MVKSSMIKSTSMILMTTSMGNCSKMYITHTIRKVFDIPWLS